MSKKDNKINPHELAGPFRILLKGGQLFAGNVKGAWDDALLLEEGHNGDTIIMLDAIAVMMEGIEPPTPGQPTEKTEQEKED